MLYMWHTDVPVQHAERRTNSPYAEFDHADFADTFHDVLRVLRFAPCELLAIQRGKLRNRAFDTLREAPYKPPLPMSVSKSFD